MDIRAFDREGGALEIFAPDMASRLGPRIPKGIENGEWSFEVRRDGKKIGSETFRYEIRSRPIACEWR
jgi:hypothetical protein